MPIFECSAILFDLDGVLADSTGSVDREWRTWARAKGLDEEKVVALVHGVRAIEVIRKVAPHLDAEAEVHELEKQVAEWDGVVAIPGAIDLVRSVPADRWGVVTSGPRHLASLRLRTVGLPVPKVLVTADEVVNGKPHPEPYLRGEELLGFAPQECLVIEDAPAGIQAAKAAGMKVIGLASTFKAEALRDADAVVKKLEQVHVTSSSGERLVVEVR